MGGKSSKTKEVAPDEAIPAPPIPPSVKEVPISSPPDNSRIKITVCKYLNQSHIQRIDLGQAKVSKPLTFVVVSDTHNYAHSIQIPNADILIHAGDFTVKGTESEVNKFNEWIGNLPHRYKVVVAGNHESKPSILKKLLTNCTFLEDEGIEIEGLYIHGTKWKGDWDLIPEKTDILITHQPPVGHLDIIYTGESRGSKSLAAKVNQIQPKFHIFGHNHEGYGFETDSKVVYICAATCMGSASSTPRRKALYFEYCPQDEINHQSITCTNAVLCK